MREWREGALPEGALPESCRFLVLALVAAACGGGKSQPTGPGPATLNVEMQFDGGGTATMTSDPAGISCPGTCSVTMPAGTVMTLTASPGTARLVRWGGGACSGTASTCQVTMYATKVVRAVFLGANYVFATSTDYAPVGLTLAGADAECAARAAEAGLPGTYVAWLSTSTVDAVSRLGTARGWVRTDGLPFADSTSALTTANAVLYPPRLDEWGRNLSTSEVITGTGPDGRVKLGYTCDDWTNTAAPLLLLGDATAGPRSWTNWGGTSCIGVWRGHLYCFGIDAVQPVTPGPVSGRRAFLSGPISPGGGVAALDGACAAEAGAAGLGGTFKALVATGTASAASRFDLTRTPWVRLDGVAVVAATADVATKDLAAPIAVGSDGAYRMDPYVWSGAASPASLGEPGATCADWTDGSAAGKGVFGFPDETAGPPPGYRTATGFFSIETTSCTGASPCVGTMGCDVAAPVYCLEE